ncbi:GNAT family N-acetyltransferase [Pseudoalteromonas sp. HL-AS2]|uniref:Acetyltransferase, GNAT family n=1 Tax=Pseudoalteromonas translucida (strain TAC 125) TaxID=326442 RepID=Q3IIT5_PSET1|nr:MULTISPECIES: GNAT family N-acetyltransferase [Pseudoalteromonas]MBB1406619.1 GNAT family N-acetyltransferase [Pseudoalteromonas sp. SG44-5]MBE0418899.1 GNAT family N-acetyltransferase [Pseudoalteromonas nigrifaciens]MBH0093216.1 GNAT family N-acetyltransferase [Pseudoalteromonas sp. SCQQ13]MBO7926186.1 GNAT family N-acetyltransferase [Pseudoalteromonas sp. K222D]WMS93546.1 GNAT family N-acetyltransferase [Pseudoalteromonas sp. HL-AS2]
MTVTTQADTFSVQYLAAEDISIAASLIYQAYHDDPILQTMLNYEQESKSAYEKKLRSLIREELSSFWQEKQPLIGLYRNDKLKAVACVFESNSQLQAQRYWHWRLKLMLSAGYLQTNQLIDKEQTIRDALEQQGNYYFLAFIAVDPHFHGQGFGRYLLRGLNDLVQSNAESTGMAVFVTRKEHTQFFKTEGFESFKQLTFNKIAGELLFKSKN